MEKYHLKEMEEKLRKDLDENRYRHTMGVMYTAASLAMAYNCDLKQAQTAGLLHDCAKCLSDKQKIKLCQKNHVPLTQFEIHHPYLIHAKLGAFLASKEYGVKDQDILHAIAYHTTGRENMSTLEKIIYIADYIEPGRSKAFRLDVIRQLAFHDLDECMYEILTDTLEYLGNRTRDIDQMTVRAFQYYKNLHMEQSGGVFYGQTRQ